MMCWLFGHPAVHSTTVTESCCNIAIAAAVSVRVLVYRPHQGGAIEVSNAGTVSDQDSIFKKFQADVSHGGVTEYGFTST